MQMERGSEPLRPRLSVIGLGKLGAPMVAVFAHKGHFVTGLDLDPDVVEAMARGAAPVQEPGLQVLIERNRERIRATSDYEEAIGASDVSFVIVPTPSREDRFFSNEHVVHAVEQIGAALRRKKAYHLVIITSTVMPGSTGGEIRRVLEKTSGRRIGPALGLCYNPEFIALGSVIKDMLHPDLVLIGESDSRAGGMLEEIYVTVADSAPEIHRMNFVNAELAKLSVNTFVTTKISYANMIADMCDHMPGADADVVTDAVGADSRIGRKYLKGAVAYGGPCFPRDNAAFGALGRALGANCELAEATDRINNHQLHRLLGAVEARAPRSATIAVLGLAYKAHTAVIEHSQGVALARALAEDGYRVVVSDPLAANNAKAVLGEKIEIADTPAAAVARADVVVLATPWPDFQSIPPDTYARDFGRVTVIDPWGMLDSRSVHDGTEVIRLGRGNWKFERSNGAAGGQVAAGGSAAPLVDDARLTV